MNCVKWLLLTNHRSTVLLRKMVVHVYSTDALLDLLRAHCEWKIYPTLEALKEAIINDFNYDHGPRSAMHIRELGQTIAMRFQQFISAIGQLSTFVSDFELVILAALFRVKIIVHTPSKSKELLPPDDAKVSVRLQNETFKALSVKLTPPAQAITEIELGNLPPVHFKAGVPSPPAQRGCLSLKDTVDGLQVDEKTRWLFEGPAELKATDPHPGRSQLMLEGFHSYFGLSLSQLIAQSGLHPSVSFQDVLAAMSSPDTSHLYSKYQVRLLT